MTASPTPAVASEGRTAVLLVQLGTPDAPEPGAVRRYLAEFLSDPRVVELPPALWRPILHGVVLRTRPVASARKYRRIWMDEGSPLMVYTTRQADALARRLSERGHDVDVTFAMRYGTPAIPKVLAALRSRGVQRLLLLPLYPQYAASTTATAFDAVAAELARWRLQPELHSVRDFHDDAGWLDALAAHVRESRARVTGSDGAEARHLVMSFHGIPQRSADAGDPYPQQCEVTARRLAERLGLAPDAWTLSYQSRFGRARWLGPGTAEVLQALGSGTCKGAPVDVVCPGFVADCLETLEEIAIEGRETFSEAGGGDLRYLPCLNDAPAFVDALADIVERRLAGWPSTQRVSTPDRDLQAALGGMRSTWPG